MKIAKKSLDIISRYRLEDYINVLLDYWESNPPIPGHGFWHILEVAINSYELGILNNYKNPDYLFIGGLFHDIYRPAEGKHGEEDQTYGAEVVKKLFEENKFPTKIKNLITNAILSHDSWRKGGNVNRFDLLLSLGDKAAHRLLLTDSFVWITNRNMETRSKFKIYSTHLETLAAFYRYQLRAWEIFMKFNTVIGIEKSIKAYMGIV